MINKYTHRFSTLQRKNKKAPSNVAWSLFSCLIIHLFTQFTGLSEMKFINFEFINAHLNASPKVNMSIMRIMSFCEFYLWVI